MKKQIAFGLCLCLALSLTACGKKPNSYEVEVVGPTQTSAPAPTKSPQTSPTPAPGWAVAPRTDLEITVSLAEYGNVERLTSAERKNLAFFTQNSKTGVIDLAGNIIVPAEKNVHWCSLCGITNEGESEIYNAKGEVVGSGGHGVPSGGVYYNETAGKIYLDDGMGYLTPWQEDMVYSPEAFIAPVVTIAPNDQGQYEVAGEAGMVNIGEPTAYMLMKPDGTPLDGVKYEALEPASEGAFAAKMAGLWGYVNAATGEQMIPFVYTQVRPFKDGLAAVKAESGWGYMSLAGVAKTRLDFAEAQTATGGKAWVKTSEGWGVAELSQWPAQ